jgi:hypothetical protein
VASVSRKNARICRGRILEARQETAWYLKGALDGGTRVLRQVPVARLAGSELAGRNERCGGVERVWRKAEQAQRSSGSGNRRSFDVSGAGAGGEVDLQQAEMSVESGVGQARLQGFVLACCYGEGFDPRHRGEGGRDGGAGAGRVPFVRRGRASEYK